MGSSRWSNDFYHEREAERATTGKSAFAYHEKVAKAPASERKVHANLVPMKIMRESRDSKEHPESRALAIVFDVTGSMGGIPRILQKKLPALMSTLLERKYVKDPQIMFAAVGDTTCDQASLQIGQFESGIEMDDDLGRMWLEGGGGPSTEESYQNALYFFARHTSCDCFEKRKEKGYLFIIGDEMPYPKIRRGEVKQLMGDILQEDVPIEDIVKEVQERFHVFFVIPQGASHSESRSLLSHWAGLLGSQNVIRADPESVCETITMTIGLSEGTVDLDGARQDLQEAGSDAKAVNAAAAALHSLAKSKNVASRTARI